MELTPQILRKIERLSAITLITLAVSACGPKEAANDPVVIQVGDRKIHVSELQAEVDYLQSKGSFVGGNEARFLESYLERVVMLENAYAAGLDQDPELQHQWENLLIGRLKQRELDLQLATISVSEEEVDAYYQAHLEQYTKPAQLRLALLFLEDSGQLSGEARSALRARLLEARGKVSELPEGTRGFGALAMTYSEEATSRFKGGDIGWMSAGAERYRWPDTVVEAGFALDAPGALSDVIETEEGFYLLMKLDAREAQVRPLDERLQASLEVKLLKAKRAEVASELQATWQSQVELTVHEAVLDTLEFTKPTNPRNSAEVVTRIP